MTKLTIDKKIQYSKDNGHFDALNSIYNKLPDGKCSTCSKCCKESVNISQIEFFWIVDQYFDSKDLFNSLGENLRKKLIKYYIFEIVSFSHCPFLDKNRQCTIYNARPLVCRIFGNQTKEAYDLNYKNIIKQNTRFARSIYMTEGIKIKGPLILREIGYCEKFEKNQPLSNPMIQDLFDEITNLDGRLYFDGIIDLSWTNSDLVGEFIRYMTIEVDQGNIPEDFWYELRRHAIIDLY